MVPYLQPNGQAMVDLKLWFQSDLLKVTIFWSCVNDESFLDTRGKDIRLFRHCAIFSREKSFGQRKKSFPFILKNLLGKSVLTT